VLPGNRNRKYRCSANSATLSAQQNGDQLLQDFSFSGPLFGATFRF
jgi:hypothetical protein